MPHTHTDATETHTSQRLGTTLCECKAPLKSRANELCFERPQSEKHAYVWKGASNTTQHQQNDTKNSLVESYE